MINAINIPHLKVFGQTIAVPAACVEVDSIEYEKESSSRTQISLKRINGQLTINNEKEAEPEESFHELIFTAKVWQNKPARDAREHYQLLTDKQGNSTITVDLTKYPDLEQYYERIESQMPEEQKLELLTEQFIQKHLYR